MTAVRIAVIALEGGWRLVSQCEKVEFLTLNAAIVAAWKAGLLTRWRGAEVELLVQRDPGSELIAYDPTQDLVARWLAGEDRPDIRPGVVLKG